MIEFCTGEKVKLNDSNNFYNGRICRVKSFFQYGENVVYTVECDTGTDGGIVSFVAQQHKLERVSA